MLRLLWDFFTDQVEQVLICDDSICCGIKCVLNICNLLSQNLHVYEPESRLDRSLEHRDWPICGHKCSTESGSTARRRLDHPETITSSEKHTIVSTRQTRIETRMASLSNLHVSRISIQFQIVFLIISKLLLQIRNRMEILFNSRDIACKNTEYFKH